MIFTDEEKIAISNKIEELYFCKNFGSTSKTDLEVLLFSRFIEHCRNAGEPTDDYSLSKQLGITQSRIRSLKERTELKYPYVVFDWKKVFEDSAKNAKFNQNDHYVRIIIEDINVMTEVRHYIEEKGWYDECSPNRKVLKLPLDCFSEISIDDKYLLDIFSPKVKKSVQALSESDSSVQTFLKDFSKDGLKSFLMSASKDAILAVLNILPFGGFAKTAFEFLTETIKNT